MSNRPVRKLRAGEVAKVRQTLAAKQKHRCPLCGKSLKTYTPALDHDHDTGGIRAVLCLNCNGMEGRVRTLATRAATRAGMVEWLENLAKYWRHYTDNPSPILHPSHKTEEEKRIQRNAKARKRRAAAKR